MLLGRSRRVHLALAVLLASLSSCQRPTQTAPDRQPICSEQCEQAFACGFEPPYTTIDECIDDCTRPDSPLWKYDECDELAEANLACIVELSCSQYIAHQEDLAASPCHATVYSFSACLANNAK